MFSLNKIFVIRKLSASIVDLVFNGGDYAFN